MKRNIAIVTGVSHSRGIGAAICRQLAKQGVDIFFIHWQAEDAWVDDFSNELQSTGVRCGNANVDLSMPQSPDQILQTVSEQLGNPAILVNNAAHSTRDGYQLLDAKTLDDHYVVNVRAACLLSVEFAKQFQQSNQSSGRIINLTSGQAQGPMIEELAYVATKGAMEAFTLSLSAEIAPLGITVNAVNPGPTDTGWMTKELKEQLTPKFLMGRLGAPEDAARLVGFLVSDEAGWITGQVINSEGGFLRN